jgi:hypothetical protein
MKYLTLTVVVSTLAAYVWALCDNPVGDCPPGVNLTWVSMGGWTCCDQTKACPINGTKWARYYRTQGLYRYTDSSGTHYCGSGPITTYPNEQDECCGDPFGAPGPWIPIAE